MPKKFPVDKGFYGFTSDDKTFLNPDNTYPFSQGDASGDGYNAKFDDDSGYRRGALGFTDENEDGLKLVNRLPDEQRQVSDKMRDILDDVDGMGSGNALTGGGGPLSKSRGVGSGPPKFRPKTGARTNARG